MTAELYVTHTPPPLEPPSACHKGTAGAKGAQEVYLRAIVCPAEMARQGEKGAGERTRRRRARHPAAGHLAAAAVAMAGTGGAGAGGEPRKHKPLSRKHLRADAVAVAVPGARPPRPGRRPAATASYNLWWAGLRHTICGIGTTNGRLPTPAHRRTAGAQRRISEMPINLIGILCFALAGDDAGPTRGA